MDKNTLKPHIRIIKKITKVLQTKLKVRSKEGEGRGGGGMGREMLATDFRLYPVQFFEKYLSKRYAGLDRFSCNQMFLFRRRDSVVSEINTKNNPFDLLL